jgi:hypothetical protein
MLLCLQKSLEHFSCIHGYIILSVAWQWVFQFGLPHSMSQYYNNKFIMLRIYINCLISCVFEGKNILVCRVDSWILHGVPRVEKGLRNTALGHEIPLAAQTGFMGVNRTWGMDICVCIFCLCVVLCRQWSCDRLIPCPRSPANRIWETESSSQGPKFSVEPLVVLLD